MLHITFDSCGWVHIFHFGCTAYLREILDFDKKIFVSGSSAGSLAAAALILNADVKSIVNDTLNYRRQYEEISIYPVIYMLDFTKKMLKKHLDENTDHKELSSKLAIHLCDAQSMQKHYVKSFKDFNHLYNCLIGSCSIPFINTLRPIKIKDKYGNDRYFIDGGILNNVPHDTLNNDFAYDNIKIKKLTFSAIGRNFSHTDKEHHIIRLSCRSPISWSFIPPSHDVMFMINKFGYLLTKKFILENMEYYKEYTKKRDADYDIDPISCNENIHTFTEENQKELDILDANIIKAAAKRRHKEYLFVCGYAVISSLPVFCYAIYLLLKNKRSNSRYF